MQRNISLIMSGTALGVPFNNWESPLKTRNKAKAKCVSTNHAGHGPRRGDPDGPPRRPTRRSPRAGSALLEGARLPRADSVPLEGVRLPRAGSASLEDPLRPRAGSASLEGTPHAHASSRTRAFKVLTSAGWRHHAPGARAPVPPHQLPRREPIPATVGSTVRRGRCQSRDAFSGTANAPSPRRGAGCTLELLSCDLAGLGEGARPVERHPCHC
jgi:hypothetical protein